MVHRMIAGMRSRRPPVAAALALAMAMSGCGIAGPRSDPVDPAAGDVVKLVTGVPPGVGGLSGDIGCYTNSAMGLLTVDPAFGTGIRDEDAGGPTPPVTPVVWRPGFTGRRIGAQIAVLDPTGAVVATTGRRYRIAGGYVGGGPDWPEMVTRVFWACDFVIPQ